MHFQERQLRLSGWLVRFCGAGCLVCRRKQFEAFCLGCIEQSAVNGKFKDGHNLFPRHHSMISSIVAPASRFSKTRETGIRVSLNTHAPLTFAWDALHGRALQPIESCFCHSC
jgi:hypothetical protein